MLFNTYQFACFLALLLPVYWLLPHRAQNVLLLAASYYFYACWNPRFLILLALSTGVDYACALAVDRIEKPRPRKWFVAISMVFNLGLLGVFKYYNFFAESLQTLLAQAGLSTRLGHLEVILPIGISFYTFQSMSYVIDVYRREIRPTRNLVQFAAFVSFFPHLVAGPIMRPTTLLPQIERPRKFDLGRFYSGWYLIGWGLTKKVVIADNLAPVVDQLFSQWQTLDGGSALLAVYAFAFQIYCDFSGYTDAARGISRLLGIELALNFNLPYFATSPRDFWGRWHISLSSWLRDYLYIPLGGNRAASGRRIWGVLGTVCALGLAWYAGRETGGARWVLAAGAVAICLLSIVPGGRLAVYRNLMLTMVIGGLWHGAAWTFVAWGAYQGFLLVAHRVFEPLLEKVQPRNRVGRGSWTALRMIVTFHLVCVGWLLFRAETLTQARAMLGAIATDLVMPPAAILAPVAACVVPLLLYQLAQYRLGELEVLPRFPWYVRSLFYTGCFYAFVIAGEYGGAQFLYFQF